MEWNVEKVRSAVTEESAFLRSAIERKRWAVVSDWVRMWALQKYGGVYFDFDVELISGIDDLLGEEWIAGEWKPGGGMWMNPGGGIALAPNSPLAGEMLALYENAGYDENAEMMSVINDNLTKALKCHPIKVLAPEWFSPLDCRGVMRSTENTRGIHHFAMSGSSLVARFARWLAWHGFGGLILRALKVKQSNVVF